MDFKLIGLIILLGILIPIGPLIIRHEYEPHHLRQLIHEFLVLIKLRKKIIPPLPKKQKNVAYGVCSLRSNGISDGPIGFPSLYAYYEEEREEIKNKDKN